MTSVKCPACKRYGEYDWHDEVQQGHGSLEFSEYGFDKGEAWETFKAVCPHCSESFDYYEVYRFDHFESSNGYEEERYTQKNLDDAARRMRTASKNRRLV